MNDTFESSAGVSNELKCHDCGAILKFLPGTHSLACEYCGAENVIGENTENIEELDFHEYIQTKAGDEQKQEISTVKCTSCGASTTLKPNITADECPFCGNSLVISSGTTSTILKPKSLLPFKITSSEATGSFHKWIKSLWFAPSKLKHYTKNIDKLSGVYIPYWTFDSVTFSQYRGARGVYYYVTETYVTTEGGKPVTRTRQVKKIRWTSVNGSINHDFDDVLVPASNSLPRKYLIDLEPWDLQNIVPFDEKYLSGFKAESYQTGLEEGFDIAKTRMEDHLQKLVRKDIGGDEQRIYSIQTKYENITFKHTLFPLWISAYRYNNKVYRFIINARTGEVKGERPWSYGKIALTILGTLAIITILALIFA